MQTETMLIILSDCLPYLNDEDPTEQSSTKVFDEAEKEALFIGSINKFPFAEEKGGKGQPISSWPFIPFAFTVHKT